jgi:hypothetical protein
MQAIAQLMQGYLHAQHLELYGDPWTAVEAFARTEDEDAPRLRAEIAELFASRPSERKLRKLLTKDLDCHYSPTADGLTYGAWLRSVSDRVDQVRSSPALRELEEIPRTYTPISGEPKIKGASSFPDMQTAELTVSTVLDHESSRVESWLRSTSGGLRLTGEFSDPVGRLMVAETGEVLDVSDVVVILRRSDALNLGYVIKAAYPAILSRSAAPVEGLYCLAQFLGVYMYQDWNDDYPTMWGAVDDFLNSEPELSRGLPRGVADLLSVVTSEEELRNAVLGPYDSWYLAEAGGWTYRNWLRAVSQRVERRHLVA